MIYHMQDQETLDLLNEDHFLSNKDPPRYNWIYGRLE